MKKSIFTTTFFSLCISVGFAQVPEGAGPNLVPNPSFEEVGGKRPSDDIDGSGAFRYNVKHWKSPTGTTPDLKIVLDHEVKKAKREFRDIDAPHSGRMMVAILTHNPSSERSDTYREYLQIKLDKPTIKNEEYYFEFWVCRAKRSNFASNNLGILLSPTPTFHPESWEPLTDMEPDFNYGEIIQQGERSWQRISGTLTSANRSNFLILGNFFDNENTKYVERTVDPSEDDFKNSYYLIDDVALHPLNPVATPPPVFEEEIEVGTVINLDRVFFETSKWALLEESDEQLDKVIELLEQYPSMEIEIHGHTDSRGSDEDNQELSENRTRSVYEYLVGKGIAESRLGYVGYGEHKPIADNQTAEGRQMNRRVEFVVTKLDKEGVEVEHSNDVKPYTDKS